MPANHYDQLKVARDAPPEVIRASYKALSQKYHPDRNPGDADAARIMQIINAAYAVLSDPDKRRLHDAWIKLQESKAAGASATGPKQAPPTGSPPPKSPPPQSRPRPPPAPPPPQAGPSAWDELFAATRRGAIWIFQYTLAISVLVLFVWIMGIALGKKDVAASKPYEATSTADAAALDAADAAVSQYDPQVAASTSPELATAPDAAATARDAAAIADAAGRAAAASVTETADPAARHVYRCIDRNGITHYSVRPLNGYTCTSLFAYTKQAAPTIQVQKDANGLAFLAPNGRPWPTGPGYVAGYPKGNTNGASTVTVDNSRNDAHVFVKLVSLDGAKAHPVRFFFIPAHGKFTVHKVSPGSYDVRYRDLSSGDLARSESFELEQNETQYTTLTMTLYKIAHGNMQTYPLAESDF